MYVLDIQRVRVAAAYTHTHTIYTRVYVRMYVYIGWVATAVVCKQATAPPTNVPLSHPRVVRRSGERGKLHGARTYVVYTCIRLFIRMYTCT